MAGKNPAKKNSGGWFAKLLILTLVLLVGARLLALQSEIDRAQAQKQSLSAQLEAQKQENSSLASALERSDDEEYLQELAREQLDMVSPGEKIFYDISN